MAARPKPLVMNTRLRDILWTQAAKMSAQQRKVALSFVLVKTSEFNGNLPPLGDDPHAPEMGIIFNLKLLILEKHQPLGNLAYFKAVSNERIADVIKAYIDDIFSCDFELINTISPNDEETLKILNCLKMCRVNHSLKYNVGPYYNIIHIFDSACLMRDLLNLFQRGTIYYTHEGTEGLASYSDACILAGREFSQMLKKTDSYEYSKTYQAVYTFSAITLSILRANGVHNSTSKFSDLIAKIFESLNTEKDTNATSYDLLWFKAIKLFESARYEPELTEEKYAQNEAYLLRLMQLRAVQVNFGSAVVERIVDLDDTTKDIVLNKIFKNNPVLNSIDVEQDAKNTISKLKNGHEFCYKEDIFKDLLPEFYGKSVPGQQTAKAINQLQGYISNIIAIENGGKTKQSLQKEQKEKKTRRKKKLLKPDKLINTQNCQSEATLDEDREEAPLLIDIKYDGNEIDKFTSHNWVQNKSSKVLTPPIKKSTEKTQKLKEILSQPLKTTKTENQDQVLPTVPSVSISIDYKEQNTSNEQYQLTQLNILQEEHIINKNLIQEVPLEGNQTKVLTVTSKSNSFIHISINQDPTSNDKQIKYVDVAAGTTNVSHESLHTLEDRSNLLCAQVQKETFNKTELKDSNQNGHQSQFTKTENSYHTQCLPEETNNSITELETSQIEVVQPALANNQRHLQTSQSVQQEIAQESGKPVEKIAFANNSENNYSIKNQSNERPKSNEIARKNPVLIQPINNQQTNAKNCTKMNNVGFSFFQETILDYYTIYTVLDGIRTLLVPGKRVNGFDGNENFVKEVDEAPNDKNSGIHRSYKSKSETNYKHKKFGKNISYSDDVTRPITQVAKNTKFSNNKPATNSKNKESKFKNPYLKSDGNKECFYDNCNKMAQTNTNKEEMFIANKNMETTGNKSNVEERSIIKRKRSKYSQMETEIRNEVFNTKSIHRTRSNTYTIKTPNEDERKNEATNDIEIIYFGEPDANMIDENTDIEIEEECKVDTSDKLQINIPADHVKSEVEAESKDESHANKYKDPISESVSTLSQSGNDDIGVIKKDSKQTVAGSINAQPYHESTKVNNERKICKNKAFHNCHSKNKQNDQNEISKETCDDKNFRINQENRIYRSFKGRKNAVDDGGHQEKDNKTGNGTDFNVNNTSANKNYGKTKDEPIKSNELIKMTKFCLDKTKEKLLNYEDITDEFESLINESDEEEMDAYIINNTEDLNRTIVFTPSSRKLHNVYGIDNSKSEDTPQKYEDDIEEVKNGNQCEEPKNNVHENCGDNKKIVLNDSKDNVNETKQLNKSEEENSAINRRKKKLCKSDDNNKQRFNQKQPGKKQTKNKFEEQNKENSPKNDNISKQNMSRTKMDNFNIKIYQGTAVDEQNNITKLVNSNEFVSVKVESCQEDKDNVNTSSFLNSRKEIKPQNQDTHNILLDLTNTNNSKTNSDTQQSQGNHDVESTQPESDLNNNDDETCSSQHSNHERSKLESKHSGHTNVEGSAADSMNKQLNRLAQDAQEKADNWDVEVKQTTIFSNTQNESEYCEKEQKYKANLKSDIELICVFEKSNPTFEANNSNPIQNENVINAAKENLTPDLPKVKLFLNHLMNSPNNLANITQQPDHINATAIDLNQLASLKFKPQLIEAGNVKQPDRINIKESEETKLSKAKAATFSSLELNRVIPKINQPGPINLTEQQEPTIINKSGQTKVNQPEPTNLKQPESQNEEYCLRCSTGCSLVELNNYVMSNTEDYVDACDDCLNSLFVCQPSEMKIDTPNNPEVFKPKNIPNVYSEPMEVMYNDEIEEEVCKTETYKPSNTNTQTTLHNTKNKFTKKSKKNKKNISKVKNKIQQNQENISHRKESDEKESNKRVETERQYNQEKVFTRKDSKANRMFNQRVVSEIKENRKEGDKNKVDANANKKISENKHAENSARKRYSNESIIPGFDFRKMKEIAKNVLAPTRNFNRVLQTMATSLKTIPAYGKEQLVSRVATLANLIVKKLDGTDEEVIMKVMSTDLDPALSLIESCISEELKREVLEGVIHFLQGLLITEKKEPVDLTSINCFQAWEFTIGGTQEIYHNVHSTETVDDILCTRMLSCNSLYDLIYIVATTEQQRLVDQYDCDHLVEAQLDYSLKEDYNITLRPETK